MLGVDSSLKQANQCRFLKSFTNNKKTFPDTFSPRCPCYYNQAAFKWFLKCDVPYPTYRKTLHSCKCLLMTCKRSLWSEKGAAPRCWIWQSSESGEHGGHPDNKLRQIREWPLQALRCPHVWHPKIYVYRIYCTFCELNSHYQAFKVLFYAMIF